MLCCSIEESRVGDSRSNNKLDLDLSERRMPAATVDQLTGMNYSPVRKAAPSQGVWRSKESAYARGQV